MDREMQDKWLRYGKGQCSTAECEEMERRLTDDESRRHARLLRQAIAAGEDVREMEQLDTDRALQHTLEVIAKAKAKFNANANAKARVIGIAAILCVPLLVTTVLLAMLLTREKKAEVQADVEVTSAPGMTVRYVLPDGTVAWLNAASRLRYHANGEANRREVFLTGEAYFHVRTNRKMPFYVHTPSKVAVYVYGTHLDVSAYEDEDSVRTVLESGEVHVAVPDRKPVVLHPGQAFTCDREGRNVHVNNVDAQVAVSWHEGRLVFRDASLENILRALARHYNVEITLDNPHGRRYHYRATFRDESVLQILDYLKQSTPQMSWHQTTESTDLNASPTGRHIVVRIR